MLILSNPVDKVKIHPVDNFKLTSFKVTCREFKFHPIEKLARLKVIKNLATHPSVVNTSVSYFVHNSAKGNSQLIKNSVSSHREFNYMS